MESILADNAFVHDLVARLGVPVPPPSAVPTAGTSRFKPADVGRTDENGERPPKTERRGGVPGRRGRWDSRPQGPLDWGRHGHGHRPDPAAGEVLRDLRVPDDAGAVPRRGRRDQSRRSRRSSPTEGHPRMETYVELHGEERRLIIPQFVTKHPTLNKLREDPRVVGIVTSLLGNDHEYAESDGNLFDCESLWHSDTYGAPMLIHHVKLSFYLDSLKADSGAIRVIPGTQHFRESFATALRNGFREPSEIEERFGVDPATSRRSRSRPNPATSSSGTSARSMPATTASSGGACSRSTTASNDRTGRVGRAPCDHDRHGRHCWPGPTNSPPTGARSRRSRELTAANREHSDPEVERQLVRLRNAAWPEVDRTGPGPPTGTRRSPDPSPGSTASPRCTRAELDAATSDPRSSTTAGSSCAASCARAGANACATASTAAGKRSNGSARRSRSTPRGSTRSTPTSTASR